EKMKHICLLLLFTACAVAPSKKTASVKIVVSEDEYLRDSGRYSTTYSILQNDCKVSWSASGNEQDTAFDLQLRSSSQGCPDFQLQRPIHQRILEKIFKDRAGLRARGLSTGSLYLIQP